MTGWFDYLWLFGIPLIFIGIIAYVYRPGAKRRYRRDAQVPLDETDDKKPQNNHDPEG